MKENPNLPTSFADTSFMKEKRIAVDNFNSRLSKKPDDSIIKKNMYAGNSKYIPIGIIESDLDKYFQEWEWIIDNVLIIGNAVTLYGRLIIMHPVTGNLITRSGIGAVPIEVEKGANPNDHTKINAKAIQKNAPAASAYALKNAAKSLGDLFGRNLNREDVVFIPLHSTKEHNKKALEDRVIMHIGNSTTINQLQEVEIELPKMSEETKKLYKEKESQL